MLFFFFFLVDEWGVKAGRQAGRKKHTQTQQTAHNGKDKKRTTMFNEGF